MFCKFGELVVDCSRPRDGKFVANFIHLQRSYKSACSRLYRGAFLHKYLIKQFIFQPNQTKYVQVIKLSCLMVQNKKRYLNKCMS